MKRLIRLNKNIEKEIIADWKPFDINDPNLVQEITNIMAANAQMQINYLNSGWRLISPYGWATSKDGNILLMAYKETGEIRSYRFDHILEVLIDDSLLVEIEEGPKELFEIEDYNAKPEEYEIPLLPNIDEVLETSEQEIGTELPFDESLDYIREQDEK